MTTGVGDSEPSVSTTCLMMAGVVSDDGSTVGAGVESSVVGLQANVRNKNDERNAPTKPPIMFVRRISSRSDPFETPLVCICISDCLTFTSASQGHTRLLPNLA